MTLASIKLLVTGSGNRFQTYTAYQLNDQEKETVIKLALTILAEKHQPGESLTSPEHTTTYLKLLLAEKKNEVFGLICLTNLFFKGSDPFVFS